MDFGVVIFPTEYTIRPDEIARALEERGFESVWFPEHTHIPASRRSPWPGGAALPKEYWHSYDPFVALTAAATVTTKLRLGTRSEEHTSELQSLAYLVCRLLLEKKKNQK